MDALLSLTRLFQSTLSVRRATSLGVGYARLHPTISIHALRKESDVHSCRLAGTHITISIHALRKESDTTTRSSKNSEKISIHALRKESDENLNVAFTGKWSFQSTLSVRRATSPVQASYDFPLISIHALRKESDLSRTATCTYDIFQSTLSVRRATRIDRSINIFHVISIHALRKESDVRLHSRRNMLNHFNPRSP